MIETHDLPDLQKARGLWQAKRFPAALDLFERTVRKHPNNLLALTDAARAFGSRYEIDKAQVYLGRLLELAPDDAGVQLMAGQSYRMIYRPDEAIACLEQALALNPSLHGAHLELSLLFERRGLLEEAMAHVDAMRTLDDCPPEVLVIGGRLSRRLNDHENATTQLAQAMDDGDCFWATRQQAGMELAKVHDAAKDYDAAIAAATHAKTYAAPHAESQVSPRDRALHAAWGTACKHITQEQFTRWSDELSQAKQHRVALLTGPPRSGTTLLENILDTHSGLVSSDERDAFPRYIHGKMFSDADNEETALDVLDRQTVPTLQGLRDRYLGFMQSALGEPIGNRLHLDKNPSITALIPGILRLFPECKIIMAIRDPRDVVLSCYLTHMPLNAQSIPYLALESAAKHYAQTMDAWLALREQLAPEQYIEVRYEDVVTDTESQARRVLGFLGLPWDDKVLAFHEHAAAKQVDSPTYEQVARPIYTSSVARRKKYEDHLAPLMETLQPYIEGFGYADPSHSPH